MSELTLPSALPEQQQVPQGFFGRHKRGVTLAAAALAFVLLGTGAVATGAAAGGSSNASAQLIRTPTATPTPTPDPRPTAAVAVPAAKLRSCSVARTAGDSRLMTLQSQVINAATGEVLFDRNSATASRSASNLKVVTSAAALAVFGPNYRVSTKVVAGAEPGTIVLVGQGDLTLTRLPSGRNSVYVGAAHLDDLATKVKAAWAAAGHTEAITKIVLDSSYFSGATWRSDWNTKGMREGYQSHVTALQVDADRNFPDDFNSSRGNNPVQRAGNAFAGYFPGATTQVGTAPAGAAALASVESAPISEMIKYSILNSDNMVAEMLARLVAIKLGTGNTFEALQPAIVKALETYGVDTTGISVVDGSGLSEHNAVPPRFYSQLFVKIAAGEANLKPILDGLPVAGQTGTLGYHDRFTGDAAIARGHIKAKTGWTKTAYTLSGIVYAQDGTTLTFSIYALGNVTPSTKKAIDLLAAAYYRCGNNLANY